MSKLYSACAQNWLARPSRQRPGKSDAKISGVSTSLASTCYPVSNIDFVAISSQVPLLFGRTSRRWSHACCVSD